MAMYSHKNKRNTPRVYSFDRMRFSCKEAADFHDGMMDRSFTPQRGFDFEDIESKSVLKIVRARGWTRWCRQQVGYAPDLLRELYANLHLAIKNRPHDDQRLIKSVVVRGVPVRFDAETIDQFYALDRRFGTMREDELTKEEMSKILCGQVVQWEKRREKSINSHLPGRMILMKWKPWNLFIHTSLVPSRQEHRIKEKNALLLCNIAQGHRLHIGQLIHQSIHDAGEDTRFNMVFPQLLTALMSEAGVNFDGVMIDESEQDLISIRDIRLYGRHMEFEVGEAEKARMNEEEEGGTLLDEQQLIDMPEEEIEAYLFPSGYRSKKRIKIAFSKMMKTMGSLNSKLLSRIDEVLMNQRAERAQHADLMNELIALHGHLPPRGRFLPYSGPTPSTT